MKPRRRLDTPGRRALYALAFAVLVCLGRGAPGGASAQVAGCGPHQSYAGACAVAAGSFADTTAGGGQANYYSIALLSDGSTLQVTLSNAAGVQAALLRAAGDEVGPVAGGLAAAIPQYAEAAGGPAGTDDASLAQPTQASAPFPAPFQSTPFQSTPFQSTAADGSSGAPVQVLAAADGTASSKTLTHFVDPIDAPELRPASLTLAVWSADGAPHTYAVSIAFVQPALTCTPGAAQLPALDPSFAPTGTASPAPAAGVETLILTNEEGWNRFFGPAGEADVMSELGRLAASPQVNGAVLSVDADSTTRVDYEAWLSDQCSGARANLVAADIKRLLERFVAANPTVRYLVIAGADPIVPFFRVADGATVAAEVQYAGQTGADLNSATPAAFAANDLLTDDYYADPHGELSGPGILFSPAMPVGRLVERPSDIDAQVETFLANGGVLQGNAGLVTGYDFLNPTAQQISAVLAGAIPAVNTLSGDSWSAAQLAGALGGTPAPDVVFFNGHFVHNALQTGGHDVFAAASLAAESALTGRLFFSLGCHSGASIPDQYAAPGAGYGVDDWAETIAGIGGALVGNTGYGYGDSDVAAYGQVLMTDLARYLASPGAAGAVAIGDALTSAKQLYRAENDGKWDAYHAKTMMEATLYGLPMYALATAGNSAPPAGPAPLPLSTARVSGYAAASSAYHVDVDLPGLARVDVPSGDGSYFTTSEGVDVRAFQPVQPQITFAVPTIPGMALHGVVVDGGRYTTAADFDPVIVRPVWDQASFEPQFDYSLPIPASLATINTGNGPSGSGQDLVVTGGRFQSSGTAFPHTVGVERVYTQLSLDLYFSAEADWNPPAIIEPAVSCSAPGSATVRLTTGGAEPVTTGTVAVEAAGSLVAGPLTNTGASWTAALRLSGPTDAISVTVVDAAGNVSTVPLALSTDVAAGCASAAGSTTSSQPAIPAAGGPAGSVTIGIAGSDPRSGGTSTTALVGGNWTTSGGSCNGTQVWQFGFFLGPSGSTPAPDALPKSTLLAPCDATGAPSPWLVQIAGGTGMEVCVGVYHAPPGTFGSADGTACASVPNAPANTPSTLAPAIPAPAAVPVAPRRGM